MKPLPPPRQRGRKVDFTKPNKSTKQRANKQQSSRSNLPPTTVRSKRDNVYYLYNEERRRVSLRLIFMLFVVFLGAVGSAYGYALIHSVQREISQTRHALNNQLLINHELETQLDVAERYSREELERLAYERLGMREPDPSQIIYFYVPPHSYVRMNINEPQEQASENYFWQGVVAFFRSMRERVFN